MLTEKGLSYKILDTGSPKVAISKNMSHTKRGGEDVKNFYSTMICTQTYYSTTLISVAGNMTHLTSTPSVRM